MPGRASKKKRSGRSTDPRRCRLQRLRAALSDQECDALLITNPNDIFYLTGFHGEDSYLLVSSRACVIISDFRFQEELDQTPRGVRVHIRDGAIDKAVGRVVADYEGLRSIGVQAEHLSLVRKTRLARAVRPARLRQTKGLLGRLRAVKDDVEVRAIRRAVRIQEEALRGTLDTLEPGVAEAEVAAELEYRMKRLGAEGPSFPTIVAAGAAASRPHYRPGEPKLRARGAVLIDWGARAAGYCGDMTRCVAFGRWPGPLAEVYDLVLEAHLTAIDAVRPGARCRDVDAAARDVIAAAGYGDVFGHGLGHGLGLDVHESPRLSRHTSETLEPGMVVTIEPGVYLPGVGGIRIEDDVLVTGRGRRNLSTLPKDRDWATR